MVGVADVGDWDGDFLEWADERNAGGGVDFDGVRVEERQVSGEIGQEADNQIAEKKQLQAEAG